MSVVAAVVSVFNLEPKERLCFLCWESSASRIHRQAGRGGGGAGGGGGGRKKKLGRYR